MEISEAKVSKTEFLQTKFLETEILIELNFGNKKIQE